VYVPPHPSIGPVTQRDISECTMTLDPISVYYDGTAKTVGVTLSHKDWGTLTSGTDYSVSYSNNTNVGTATVTASGTGNYTGSKTGSFEIIEPETGPYRFYSKSNQFMSGLKTLDMSKLPKIGDTIVFKEYTEGDNYYDIVGYDVTVPEYVGYINGSEVIYVRVWDDTTNNTRSVAVGDKTYSRSFVTGGTYSTFTETGKTVSAISGTFSYGNLNPFSVPATITVGGKTYAFCGHTATVLSKQIRGFSKFDGSNSVWKTSTIRSLVSENFGWERQEVLLKNMMKSCNITADTNKTDNNGNTLDQFFIPSSVELGRPIDSYLKDNTHSKFKKSDTEYLDNAFRTKGVQWWARSQYANYSYGVWYVTADGGLWGTWHFSN